MKSATVCTAMRFSKKMTIINNNIGNTLKNCPFAASLHVWIKVTEPHVLGKKDEKMMTSMNNIEKLPPRGK
jgi:hypothetical protein